MGKLLKAVLLIIASLAWLTLLCSLSLKMFAWRVDLEPGATKIPELHYASIAAFLIGSVLTVLVHFIFARKGEKYSAIWWANLVATILYLPAFLLTLLLMV
jgi:hypothetical protein